jgi:hypothetical protein
MASTDKIHLNLDEAERPDDQKFDLFAFNLKDRRIEVSDPAEIDYQDLLECETPIEFFRFTMSQDDRDFLAAQRMPAWRLGLLLEKYLTHYKAKERIDQRKKLGF